MEPRWTGTWGALATRLPVGIEERAGEIEPFLDVHRIGRVLQRRAHLFGDVHEEVVEHLQHDRIGIGAQAVSRARAATTRSRHEVAQRVDPARHSGFDHGGAGRLADDGRAAIRCPGEGRRGVDRGGFARSPRRGYPRVDRRRRVAVTGGAGGAPASVAPMASTSSMSKTMSRSAETKPKRALCAASKLRAALGRAEGTASAWCEPA
jgi:hypothetical protein